MDDQLHEDLAEQVCHSLEHISNATNQRVLALLLAERVLALLNSISDDSDREIVCTWNEILAALWPFVLDNSTIPAGVTPLERFADEWSVELGDLQRLELTTSIDVLAAAQGCVKRQVGRILANCVVWELLRLADLLERLLKGRQEREPSLFVCPVLSEEASLIEELISCFSPEGVIAQDHLNSLKTTALRHTGILRCGNP